MAKKYKRHANAWIHSQFLQTLKETSTEKTNAKEKCCKAKTLQLQKKSNKMEMPCKHKKYKNDAKTWNKSKRKKLQAYYKLRTTYSSA